MTLEKVFGIHAVSALIDRSAARIDRLQFSDGRRDTRLDAVRQKAATAGISCQELPAKEFQQQFDQWRHQGVVAHCRALEPLSEAQLLDTIGKLSRPALVLVLDQITDPHNFGAILRTADAAGVDAVVIPKKSSVGVTPVVRKVASGAAESVPICRVTNLARFLAELKSLGLWLYGAAGENAAVNYDTVDYRGSAALVMGAEGAGLRRLTREACDQLIRIPMAGLVSSLNVSVATGVCLYEVVRQRNSEKIPP